MNIEEYREYCLKKPGVTEGFPFDNRTLVFKVGGKMFVLLDVENFERVNLKCDPELAIELREEFEEVEAGYHMNKKHWNTVYINKKLSDKKLLELTDHSYNLVLSSLPKSIKQNI